MKKKHHLLGVATKRIASWVDFSIKAELSCNEVNSIRYHAGNATFGIVSPGQLSPYVVYIVLEVMLRHHGKYMLLLITFSPDSTSIQHYVIVYSL